jgi:hypothetical protein
MVIALDVTVNSNFGYVNLILIYFFLLRKLTGYHLRLMKMQKKKNVQTEHLGIRPSVLLLRDRSPERQIHKRDTKQMNFLMLTREAGFIAMAKWPIRVNCQTIPYRRSIRVTPIRIPLNY